MTSLESDMLGQTEPSATTPQSREWTPPDATFTKKIAHLIADIHVAMLTTVAPDGSLRSRPMATLNPPLENGEVWFFTADDSPKAAEIAAEHEVNLAYSEPARDHYVSLSGTASLVRDPERARRSWNPAARTWFPGGHDDPRLVLLRVRVRAAHAWDAKGGRMTEIGPEPGAPSPAVSPKDAAVAEKMRLGR